MNYLKIISRLKRVFNEERTNYGTIQHTLDTADYVPEKFNKKIHKYIFKNMNKQLKKVDRIDRQYQNKLKQAVKD